MNGSEQCRASNQDPVRSRASLFARPCEPGERWRGIWPRLFIDVAELDELRTRLESHPAWRNLYFPPDDSPDFERAPLDAAFDSGGRLQAYSFLRMTWHALLYRITGEEKYLRAARYFIPYFGQINARLLRLKIGGDNQHQDLFSGFFLWAAAWAYDLLHGALPADEEALLRTTLAAQARLLFDDFESSTNVTAYEQNHTYIPACGLGLAAIVLWGEEPDAGRWLGAARAIMDRSGQALGADGYFFESVGYFGYAYNWHVMFAAALKRMTGEDWFPRPLFHAVELYVSHSMLPGGKQAFDLADWGPKKGQPGYDAPWHTHPTEIAMPPLLGIKRHSPPNAGLDALIRWLQPRTTPWEANALFELVWGDPPPAEPVAMPDGLLPHGHHFASHDVLFWRSSWSNPNAVAAVFKAGPPEGHHAAALLREWPDWRMNSGHAHPDAGSFILFAGGKFLANDTGYTARKWTRDHNCLLIDGEGQLHDGRYHCFNHVDYRRLDAIRLEDVRVDEEVMTATAILDEAYDESLWMREVRRCFVLVQGRWLVIYDRLVSRDPRVYTFLWHADTPPRPAGRDCWLIDQGESRVVLRSLLPIATSTVTTTVVEAYTDVPDAGEPMQRGWHLANSSESAQTHRFLHVAVIGDGHLEPDDFHARLEAGGVVHLSLGRESCEICLPEREGDQVKFTVSSF